MMTFAPEGFLFNTDENKNILSSFEKFNKAFLENRPVEARVSFCDCAHNLHIDLGFIEGIIPRIECAAGIENGSVKDIAIISRVNKPVKFLIDSIDTSTDKPIAYLSRRKMQKKFEDDFLSFKKPGDIIQAKVTHLESFGAFCDIGCGMSALLPIDNISVSRIPHPKVRFDVGDVIRVIIKSFDDAGRVILSHKELLGTWEENANLFSVGETVSGIIRSIESYGIFVELTPNLSGLAEYSDSVCEGDLASIYIKSIIPEKMKFKLVIVDSFEDNLIKRQPNYFIESDHISNFIYSPKNSQKLIETTFE